MPHSYVSKLMHYIFSTKERFPFIDPELESRLWPYLGGIARENGMKALAVAAPPTTYTPCYHCRQR